MFEPLAVWESIGGDLLNAIMETTYFRWGLLLFIVAIVGSIVSGLIDVAITVAQYGAVLLLALGLLEVVAPGFLTSLLGILFVLV